MPDPRLRVTNHDREQVVEHVKAAYAEGRLDKPEFDDRLERAMTARTHGELMPIMNELYGAHPAAVPTVSPHHPGVPGGREPYPGGEIRPRGGADYAGATAAHLLPLCGLLFVGPLIMMLTMGKTSPYVRKHAVEALNFQLTLLGATVLLPFTVVGVVLIPVMWVAALVLSIVGGAAAFGDGGFRYPLTVRLIN